MESDPNPELAAQMAVERIERLQESHRELVKALGSMLEPLNDSWYCDYCDRHAPKHSGGQLTGERLTHHEDCAVVLAREALKKAKTSQMRVDSSA